MVRLAGPSSLTGREERVTVVVGNLSSDAFFQTLLIAPEDRYAEADKIFNYLLSSMQITNR